MLRGGSSRVDIGMYLEAPFSLCVYHSQETKVDVIA